MIRIKDIAEKAGVSPTTVSNVINGNTKKVSPKTIEKIQKLLDKHDYVPSMGARMLAQNRSRIIGVLLGGKEGNIHTGQGEAFANIIIRALEHEIFNRGFYMLLHLSKSTEENLQLAALWKVEGLISIGLSAEENLQIQSRCAVPLVSIDNYYDTDFVANIGLDDWRGGYKMGKFLIERKLKNILFLSDNDIGVDHYRWLGLQQAVLEEGVVFEKTAHCIFPDEVKERIKFYEENLKMLLSKDVLFFASDYYALEAMNFLQDKNVKIPADISVTGFDDNEYARIARPMLTTIRQDVSQKGISAVEMLFNILDGKENVERSIKLETKLVVRRSVK